MRFSAYLLQRLVGVWFLVAALPVTVGAYELDTHEQLSLAAFRISRLATTLQSVYGIFPTDTFRRRLPLFPWRRNTPEESIAAGARNEDWLSRPLNHFYDPYHDAPLGILGGATAPDWALEDAGDLVGQDYSYKDAREAFYRGLTARDPATHDRELGHTFYALGHVIHLIQDMAQPQHTRNDVHPDFIPPRASWMEAYIEGLAPRLNSTFALDGAAVPDVTRGRDLWVTQTGDRMTGSGMAEFSNMNFVSAGTNFTELRTGAIGADFPRPALNIGDFSLSSPADACTDGAPAPGSLIFYANTFADPVIGADLRNERMTTHSIFDQHLISRGRPPIFALNCFNLDTAADILLPRAVSYSAALLRYFFRGQLEIAPPARFAYGLAAFQPGNTGAFTSLRFRVRNATPNEDAGPGQMTAVVRYRTSSKDLIETPWADISGPRYAVSRALDLDTVGRAFEEFVFDFTDSPIPTNSADLFLTVVHRGPLGLEDDAVLVGGKDLFEPDPVDSANISDYDCFAGALYPVVDLPPYSYPAHIERDKNGDRVQDLFGPWIERTHLIKTFDLEQGLPALSEQDADFNVAELLHGRYARFMLLQELPVYGAMALDRQAQEIPSGVTSTNSQAVFALAGVLNDVVRGSSGEIIRRVLFPAVYRGIPTFHMTFRYNGNTEPCLPQTQFLPPLTRTDGVLAPE